MNGKTNISKVSIRLYGGERDITAEGKQSDSVRGRSLFFRADDNESYLIEISRGRVKVRRSGSHSYTLVFDENETDRFGINAHGLTSDEQRVVTHSLDVRLLPDETFVEAEYNLSFEDASRRFLIHAKKL